MIFTLIKFLFGLAVVISYRRCKTGLNRVGFAKAALKRSERWGGRYHKINTLLDAHRETLFVQH